MNVYSRGMGGLGLPGDLSSVSRFVKATFKKNEAYAQVFTGQSYLNMLVNDPQSSNKKEYAILEKENTNIRFILLAVTLIKGFIIIVRMKTVKLLL
ncbi:hypothetical protein EfmJHP38_05420 [Enterococcus faecium]|nr:hypothetical protein EfmJHP38_05420 [Enterococcus faecium]